MIPRRAALNALGLLASSVFGLAIVVVALKGPSALDPAVRGFWEGALANRQALGGTAVAATPIFLVGIAAALSFRADIFNLGQVGQYVLGALACAVVGSGVDGPHWLTVPLALAAGAAAGGLWSAATYLCARLIGLNLAVMTLMINYLAEGLASVLVTRVFNDPGAGGIGVSRPVHGSLPIVLSRSGIHLGVLLTAVAAIPAWWWATRTRSGHRLRLYGLNPRFAALAGTPPLAYETKIVTMSGAICGVAGSLEVLGIFHNYLDGSVGGPYSLAWSGLTLAVLAGVGTTIFLAGAVFLALLQTGLSGVQFAVGVSNGLGLLVQGLMLLVIAIARRRRTSFVVIQDRPADEAVAHAPAPH